MAGLKLETKIQYTTNPKMSRTFLNISKEECADASLKVLQNSDNKFLIADKLAQDNEYGLAITTLIVGCEESIKALVLHLDSVGFNLRDTKGMRGVFENHELKHFISFVIFIYNIISTEFTSFLKNSFHSVEEYKKFEKFSQKLQNEDIAAQRLLISKMIRIYKKFKAEMEWFSNFEIFRQQGNYVDYHNEIKSPQYATAQDYYSLKARTDKVKDTTREIIETINSNNEENIRQLDELQKVFIMNKIPSKISSFISNTKKSKMSALNYSLNQIQSFMGEFPEVTDYKKLLNDKTIS